MSRGVSTVLCILVVMGFLLLPHTSIGQEPGSPNAPSGATVSRVGDATSERLPPIYRLSVYCTYRPKIRRQTGFLVKSEGYSGIVTALHGIADCSPATTEKDLGGDSRRHFSGLEIRKVDLDYDVALLSSQELDAYLEDLDDALAFSQLETAEELARVDLIDQEFAVVGYPIGLDNQDRTLATIVATKPLNEVIPPAYRGDLAARNSPNPTVTILQAQAPLLPGHSGAPLLTHDDRVLGMVNGGLEQGTIDRAWIIPWADIQLQDISHPDIEFRLNELKGSNPQLAIGFSATFQKIASLEVDSQDPDPVFDDLWWIRGTAVNQFRRGDELVVYSLVEGEREQPIALLHVVDFNRDQTQLLAQVTLIHPYRRIQDGMAVDEDVDRLWQAALVPAFNDADGFLLEPSTVRVRHDSRLSQGSILTALELEVSRNRILDIYLSAIHMRVTSVGLRGNSVQVELINPENGWPSPGTLVRIRDVPLPTNTPMPTSTPVPTATNTPTPTSTPTPTQPAAGSTWTNPIDGAVYVYVPAGEFVMGDWGAEQTVSVDSFWIMHTEVTNEQYKSCVEAEVCTKPDGERWNDNAYADHPVTSVDWFQASEYAEWVDGRLPTEAEWEKACRGTDGRIYPWGNEQPTEDLANYYEPNLEYTTAVGSYSPYGDSPYGVADIAGNAWEWTSEDRYNEAKNDRMMRGVSFGVHRQVVRCAFRVGVEPDFSDISTGFRVVSPGPTAGTPTATVTPTPTATDTPTPTPEPTEPEPGTTWTNPIDGAVYVYVPAGEFMLGSTESEIDAAVELCQEQNEDCDRSAFVNETPSGPVNVDGFWIMRTKVTNKLYQRCVEADACTEPDSGPWNDSAYADHPVTDVDWLQANEYAEWVGGRLPTEAQWEKACRGVDGHMYPWGDTPAPNKELANYGGTVEATTPVDAYSPQGDSPYGVADMGGNVGEWTSSKFDQELYPYPYDPEDGREDPEGDDARALRGNAWFGPDVWVRCAFRLGFDRSARVHYVGFRVVVLSPTQAPTPINTPVPTETDTPTPTSTPVPTATDTPTPTSTPTPTPTVPSAGSTWTNPTDGAVYVYVPAGEFLMGSSESEIDAALELCQDYESYADCERSWFAGEAPQRTVSVDGFWIMRTEVTNEQYRRCVEAGACTPDDDRWNDSNAYADHPVTHLDWSQASEYAKWAGGRLPTDAEWEKACRGTDGHMYPWGNGEPTDDLANFGEHVGETTAVGSYSPQGDSPYGVADMAGNVFEWTADWYDENQTWRTVRGGAFAWYYVDVRCASRVNDSPSYSHRSFGFRVVMSSPDS